MKKSIKKTISVILTITLVLTAAFSVNAANFSDTKTKAFIDDLRKEKALTINYGDYNRGDVQMQDLCFYIQVKNIDTIDVIFNEWLNKTIQTEDELIERFFECFEIKASAKVKLNIPVLNMISANLFYDGSEFFAYIFGIFKVNLSSFGLDITMFIDEIGEPIFYYILLQWFADSPLAYAISVIETREINENGFSFTAEKFSFTVMDCLTSITGANEQEIQSALSNAGYEIKGLTENEVLEVLLLAYANNDLARILSSVGSGVEQFKVPAFILYETGYSDSIVFLLDFLSEFIDENGSVGTLFKGDSFCGIVFFEGNKITNGYTYDAGDFGIATFTAGKGKVKNPPIIGIDITGMILSILGNFM